MTRDCSGPAVVEIREARVGQMTYQVGVKMNIYEASFALWGPLATGGISLPPYHLHSLSFSPPIPAGATLSNPVAQAIPFLFILEAFSYPPSPVIPWRVQVPVQNSNQSRDYPFLRAPRSICHINDPPAAILSHPHTWPAHFFSPPHTHNKDGRHLQHEPIG
jgi:hypothetical protein